MFHNLKDLTSDIQRLEDEFEENVYIMSKKTSAAKAKKKKYDRPLKKEKRGAWAHLKNEEFHNINEDGIYC